MGCLSSLCKNNVQIDIEDQYKTLVVTKPAPVVLNDVLDQKSSDTDVPLFAEVSSDSDGPAIQVPASVTDEELNLYAESLNKKLD